MTTKRSKTPLINLTRDYKIRVLKVILWDQDDEKNGAIHKRIPHSKNQRRFNFLIFFTPSQISPGFYVQIFWKKPWEKKRNCLLRRGNFSFFHGVFYPLREFSAIFITFEIVVCKLFQFGRVKN